MCVCVCVLINPLYVLIKYLAYIVYMHNLVGTCVSGTYLSMTCKIEIARNCGLVSIQTLLCLCSCSVG